MGKWRIEFAIPEDPNVCRVPNIVYTITFNRLKEKCAWIGTVIGRFFLHAQHKSMLYNYIVESKELHITFLNVAFRGSQLWYARFVFTQNFSNISN